MADFSGLQNCYGCRAMDVRLSEEQELLRQSAREFLARECPMSRVRSAIDDPRGASDTLWNQMAELGWPGLVIPECYGGAGLGAVELAVLFEETGRVLLPGSLFAHVALGGVAIDLAGSPEQKQRMLPALAEGSARVTFAQLEEGSSWGPEGIRLEAKPEGDGYRLVGTKVHVPDAHLADWLVVPARCVDGDAAGAVVLCLVAAAAPGVTIRPFAFVDETRKMCQVELHDVAIPPEDVLRSSEAEGSGDAGSELLERILDVARVALSAELCGASLRVLDMSVEYAKTREQFGRKIGSFQAIAHKCADMFVRAESARSATYYAAWAVANHEPDAHTSACLAKAYCCDAASHIAGEGIQIHGGLGFAWEQDPQLYFRRAKASEHFLGDPSWNRELAARVLLDDAPAREAGSLAASAAGAARPATSS